VLDVLVLPLLDVPAPAPVVLPAPVALLLVDELVGLVPVPVLDVLVLLLPPPPLAALLPPPLPPPVPLVSGPPPPIAIGGAALVGFATPSVRPTG
jgi:hypothetical protein